MRIECDQCAAKYSVADAKIKTRSFKIRCKQCREFIVVRDRPQPQPSKTQTETDAMTGQRSDNSVLFSLDKIAPPAAARQASASQLSPARKPVSGGSGLIDIRKMSEVLSEQRATTQDEAPEEELGMPSFGGAGLGGLSAEPLVLTPISPPPVSPRPQGSTRPLYALISLLTLGVFGLGAYVALDEPAPATVTTVVEAAVAAETKTKTETEAETDPEGDAVETETEVAAPEAAALEQSEASTANRPTRNRNRNRNRNRARAEAQPKQPVAAHAPKAAKQPGGPVDVDCLLDNSLDKCGGKEGSTQPKQAQPSAPVVTPSDDSDLPNKLGASQISKGIAPVKSKAKSCGSGATVAVKFSVEGKSGEVISARALDEHAASSVGACVVEAAKRASFARFRASQQGFTIKFRL